MANALKKALIGGAVAAGLGVWAVAPRTFNNKRKNFVPTLQDVLYIALARRMALRAGYGSIDEPGPLAPENSLAAFAAAAEAGYGIELDVQLTLDNKAVVCHDPDLLRVAGDPRNIRALTYDELVRIPLFPTAAPGAEVSPLLPGATENPPLVTRPGITSMCRCSRMCCAWWTAACRSSSNSNSRTTVRGTTATRSSCRPRPPCSTPIRDCMWWSRSTRPP